MSTTTTGTAAAGTLGVLSDAQAAVDAGEVALLVASVEWAVQHPSDSIVGPVSEWSQSAVPVAGEGAPEVAEFCVAEYAAVLGVSTDAGRARLGTAVELFYRLPKTYAAVVAGGVRVWKARRIAELTMSLPPAAAAYVDRHLAPVLATLNWAGIGRLVDAARVRFDPEAVEAARVRALEYRRFDVDLDQARTDGTVDVVGTLDLADALDLETAVARGAHQLARAGCDESLDVRRSLAVGELARRDHTLDLDTDTDPDLDASGPAPAPAPASTGRGVTLYVRLDQPDVATLDHTRSTVTVGQVRAWCQTAGTRVTVKPFIDLNAVPVTGAYQVPDRMREQVMLRDRHCVFPHCTRPATRCDVDHITPWQPGAEGGSTSPPNLAPLCRRHHRLKTHSLWHYANPTPGTYTWTSPHGHTFTTGRT